MPENPNQPGSRSSGGSGGSNQQSQGSSGLQTQTTQTTQTTQPQRNVQSTVGNNNTPTGQNLPRDHPNQSIDAPSWTIVGPGRALSTDIVDPTDPAYLDISDDEKEKAEEDKGKGQDDGKGKKPETK